MCGRGSGGEEVGVCFAEMDEKSVVCWEVGGDQGGFVVGVDGGDIELREGEVVVGEDVRGGVVEGEVRGGRG